jgi:hypothetical protein
VSASGVAETKLLYWKPDISSKNTKLMEETRNEEQKIDLCDMIEIFNIILCDFTEGDKHIWYEVVRLLSYNRVFIKNNNKEYRKVDNSNKPNLSFLPESGDTKLMTPTQKFSAICEVSTDVIEIKRPMFTTICKLIREGELIREGDRLFMFVLSLPDIRKHIDDKLSSEELRSSAEERYYLKMKKLCNFLMNSLYSMLVGKSLSAYIKKEHYHLISTYAKLVDEMKHLFLYMDADTIISKSGKKYEIAEILETHGYEFNMNPIKHQCI